MTRDRWRAVAGFSVGVALLMVFGGAFWATGLVMVDGKVETWGPAGMCMFGVVLFAFTMSLAEIFKLTKDDAKASEG